MEETNDSGFSVSSLGFIFRHPWVILFSFLIVLNIFHAYATSIPPEYRSGALLLFAPAPGATARPDAINEKKSAAERIATGPNIDLILTEAFKDESADERSSQYDRIASMLSNPKTGIRFFWEAQGASNLLRISFACDNARLCHNVVKAAMDMIIRESEQKVTRQLQANMAFLNDQQLFYKGKLDTIDKEIESIRDELVKRFPELTDEDKELITKSSGDTDISKKGSLRKLEAQEEAVSRLKTSISEIQQNRDRLQESIDSGTFMIQYSLDDINRQDLMMAELSKAVSVKEVEISAMVARGYKDEHPMVKQLLLEIVQLKDMRQKRSGRLRTAGPGTEEYDEAKERARREVEGLDVRIAFMKNSLKTADESKKASAAQIKTRMPKASEIKERVSRLMILKSERDINEQYYGDMKRKLADADLKMRTEKQDFGFNIEIAQAPAVPGRPDPSRSMNIVFKGFVVALLAGGGLAYLMDMLKNGIHTQRELSHLLGAPVLATIDRITTAREVAAEHRRLKLAVIGVGILLVASRILIAAIFSVHS